jgi:hypothetical protein
LFNKPWFHNWGKTCCCAHHTFSWGSQLVGHLYQHRTINADTSLWRWQMIVVSPSFLYLILELCRLHSLTMGGLILYMCDTREWGPKQKCWFTIPLIRAHTWEWYNTHFLSVCYNLRSTPTFPSLFSRLTNIICPFSIYITY